MYRHREPVGLKLLNKEGIILMNDEDIISENKCKNYFFKVIY